MPNSHGLARIKDILWLQESNSFDAIVDYLAQFQNWNLLVKDPSMLYRWSFTPKGTKSADANEEYQLSVLLEKGRLIVSLIIPDERLLVNYIKELSGDSDYVFVQTEVVKGNQHHRYKTSRIVIQLGEKLDRSFYVNIYPRDLYEEGMRIH